MLRLFIQESTQKCQLAIIKDKDKLTPSSCMSIIMQDLDEESVNIFLLTFKN